MDQFVDNVFSRRLLSSFNISDEILDKLVAKGLTQKSDIQHLKDSQLKSMCDLSDQQMDVINQVIRSSHKSQIEMKTVREIMANSPTIASPSLSLNRALGGGLEVSKVTQFCGEAGVGKTQICMQFCIDVQLPQSLGGLSGQALYIDTESALRAERLTSMANFYLQLYPKLNQTLSAQSMTSAVHVFKCNTTPRDLVELIVTRVEPYIDMNPQIRLIVIDSIAQLFRYDYKGTNTQKEYELSQIGHKLKFLAHHKKVAILITNQVSFNPLINRNVPSLGKRWQTYCSTSFMIKREPIGGSRVGSIIRSTNVDTSRRFYYYITENGIKEGLEGLQNDSYNRLQIVP